MDGIKTTIVGASLMATFGVGAFVSGINAGVTDNYGWVIIGVPGFIVGLIIMLVGATAESPEVKAARREAHEAQRQATRERIAERKARRG